MRVSLCIVGVLVLLAAGAAQAQDAASTENGRYSMTPTADGFLRLDTRSGAVSLCTVAGGVAKCSSSADERAALEAEIARLTQENTKLKSAQIGRGKMPELPSDEQMDKALSFMEKFMRRMIGVMREDVPKDRT